MKTLKLPNNARLAFLAATVAVDAPLKQGEFSSRAYIPWETIHEIRAELEKAGWPWRAALARRVEIQKETRREMAAERASGS